MIKTPKRGMTNQPLSLIHAFASKMGEAKGTMHNLAVGLLSGLISELLVPNKAEIMYMSGLLHDIGAIGIFEGFFREPVWVDADITSPDASELLNHPLHSYNMLKDIGLDSVGVLEHHELLNGKGYPFHKEGGEVSREGYIMGISDKIELLMQQNPFQRRSAVVDRLKEWIGVWFPEEITEAACDVICGDYTLFYDLYDPSALQERIEDFEGRYHFDNLLRIDELKLLRFFASAIELKHPYTMDHSTRVSLMASEIAKRLGLPPHKLLLLQKSSYLHDIGKIVIPRGVLIKPTVLTPSEKELIYTHVVKGYELLNKVPMTKDIALIAVSHHEAFNGDGYPLGLKGEEIPFLSRIITIVDIFDALTSSRSYRKAYSPEEAVRIMEQEMIFMFDPELFEVSKGILKEIIRDRLKLT